MKRSINKLEFNACEFASINNTPEAFIVLLFALYAKKHSFSGKLSSNRYILSDKLYISRIPMHLIHKKYLLEKSEGIFANFNCAEPQVYVKNCAFLHLNVPPIQKYQYIQMLSQRSIDDSSDSIPDCLVDESVYINNPLITHHNQTIHFKLEKI